MKLPKLKRPDWFKWEPTGYWALQTMSSAAVAATLICATYAEARGLVVTNGFLAGFNAAAIFHNWLHRRRDQRQLRLIKIMDEQQELIIQIAEMKTDEISRMIDHVSIQGPDGPITPNPTKH